MYSNIVSHYHANFDCPYLQHEREQVMTTNVWLTQVRQIIKKTQQPYVEQLKGFVILH